MASLFPELNLFETDEDRRAVLRKVRRRLIRSWRFWLHVIAGNVLAVLFCFWNASFLRQMLALPMWAYGLIVGATMSACFGGVFTYLFRKPIQRHLRNELIARRIPICITCGYDLRGQIEPRCPECDTEFDPQLLMKHN